MQSSGNKICNILKSMQILKDSINLRNLWNGVERSTDSKKKLIRIIQIFTNSTLKIAGTTKAIENSWRNLQSEAELVKKFDPVLYICL